MSSLSDAIHEKYESALQDQSYIGCVCGYDYELYQEAGMTLVEQAEDDARLACQEENP